jgi:hypothetical protein
MKGFDFATMREIDFGIFWLPGTGATLMLLGLAGAIWAIPAVARGR